MSRHLYIDQLKSNPCADCGRTFPPECMDFDHVRGEKLGNVSRMSLKQALAELWKCELVCATCHRERTMNRRLDIHIEQALMFDDDFDMPEK